MEQELQNVKQEVRGLREEVRELREAVTNVNDQVGNIAQVLRTLVGQVIVNIVRRELRVCVRERSTDARRRT